MHRHHTPHKNRSGGKHTENADRNETMKILEGSIYANLREVKFEGGKLKIRALKFIVACVNWDPKILGVGRRDPLVSFSLIHRNLSHLFSLHHLAFPNSAAFWLGVLLHKSGVTHVLIQSASREPQLVTMNSSTLFIIPFVRLLYILGQTYYNGS